MNETDPILETKISGEFGETIIVTVETVADETFYTMSVDAPESKCLVYDNPSPTKVTISVIHEELA